MLLGQPVGVLTGQGSHQGGLAVVDVACRGDDLHGSVLDGTAVRRGTIAASCDGSTATRSRSSRPLRDVSEDRRGGRFAAGRRATPGGRRPRSASSTPGAPPPPTSAVVSTTSVSTSPCELLANRRRLARSGSSRVRLRACGTGDGGPSRVASSAARVSLSTRRARATGCRRIRVTRSAEPSTRPACGPPSSLSPEAVTSAAPARRVVAASGSTGSRGCGGEQPGADVDDDRDRQGGELGDIDRRGESRDGEVRGMDLENHGCRVGRWPRRSRRR